MEFTRINLDRLRRKKPKGQRTIWDTKQTGLCLLWSPGPADKAGSTVTLRVIYYLRDATQPTGRYLAIGRYPDGQHAYRDARGKEHVIQCSDLSAVRARASDIRNDAKERNIDPTRPRMTGNFKEMVDEFIRSHASTNKSCAETVRIFNRYVLPEWGDRNIEDIKKSDVSELLKTIKLGKIKGDNGDTFGTPNAANCTLAQVSKMFNWYVANHGSDAFRSPVVKGMRLPDGKVKVRDRALSDDEIRAMWSACTDMGTYGAVIQCALLTAQRFFKVAQMRRSEIKDRMKIPGRQVNDEWVPDLWIDTVWDPTSGDDPTNKQTSVVPLSGLARAIIEQVPVIDADRRHRQDYVFSLNGREPLQGWSRFKRQLDNKMLAILQQRARDAGNDPNKVKLELWQQRDLRRTAKTLMGRAGVEPHISEHCLAHAMPIIERTYDRFDYLEKKRDAFEKLAALVDRIVNPDPTNVVKLVDPTSSKVRALR
jgi:integrase